MVWLVILILAILIGVWWYFTVVLICVFLMTPGVEHLFMYLFAICISPLVKCLFNFLHNCELCCLISHWVLRVLCVFWMSVLYQLSDL